MFLGTLAPAASLLDSGFFSSDARIKTAVPYPGKRNTAIALINNNGGESTENQALVEVNFKSGLMEFLMGLPADLHGITRCE